MSFLSVNAKSDLEMQRKAEQARREIVDSLDHGRIDELRMGIIAFILNQVSSSNNPMDFDYQTLLSTSFGLGPDSSFIISEAIDETEWTKLSSLSTKYVPDVFAVLASNVCRQYSDSGTDATEATPDSIVRLAQRILAIKPDDKVADICCGSGTFILKSAVIEPAAHYYGCEINPNNKLIATINSILLDDAIEIELQDAFNLLAEHPEIRFDKIFSNYPLRLPMRSLGKGTKLLEQISEVIPGFSKVTSSDWIFNALLVELLADGGKAIGIMTNGSTWNGTDVAVRKFFVENGFIESVIALPGRMFVSTPIPTSLIVLSKGNTKVRIVDATKLCHQGRRYNEFNPEDVETILTALQTDSEYSKIIELERLRENDYTLHLGRYLEKEELTFKDARPFGEVIKSIKRGAPCTARQLDEMASDKKTNMQFLMLGNIQNGIIDEELPYLSRIDSNLEKYCLKDNSLILTKNGYPYKVAIARVPEGHKIMANGNLYIIEVDEEKADPVYLKAFFESEKGIGVLKSITVGATIPSIGVDNLKKVQIPIPTLEEQKHIAGKYQAALDEIAIYKLKIEKAMGRLHHIFDEESEG